ncbi:MAG: nucleoside 2-deoxyribosyltransferase [Patescibacteria group bacterium]|nr:nucleoside 2-deoxyribosyltransferase [Patescibacteria group bacterium]MDE2438283.1 nucleoside 2-deoxyribosyltransferase [Patescibacteria group bacterium]
MRSVVLCGSTRFKSEIQKLAADLRKLGVVVYEPHLHNPKELEEMKSMEHKKLIALGLTHDHFYKIRMADVVFIYNKNGYSGNGTTLEIGFAVGAGKPIYALSPENDELVRLVLFRGVAKSPQALVKLL